MSDDLQEKVARLEEQLRRKDDEARAKQESFTDALEREQAKLREREARENAKREEVNQRVLRLTDECGRLRCELDALREQEEEFKRADAQVRQLTRELGLLRVSHAEERQNLSEQLEEKRRHADRAQQELADLRCQLSIMEHKYQHAMAKQQQQESQAEEMSRAHLSVQQLQERLEDSEREQEAEAVRFVRDRKALEERLTRLQQELHREREGVSRVELTARYQSIISARTQLLAQALNLAARTGGPLAPRDAEDEEAVSTYLAKLERFLEESREPTIGVARVASAARRGHPADRSAEPASGAQQLEVQLEAAFGSDVASLLGTLVASLQRVCAERRPALVRRFVDASEANVANPRRFAERSGMPSAREEPLVLVHQLANLTAERDALLARVKALEDDAHCTATGPRALSVESRSASMHRAGSSPSPNARGASASASASASATATTTTTTTTTATATTGRAKSPAAGRRSWK